MGNAVRKEKNNNDVRKPRVVLESPIGPEDERKRVRVRFAGVKNNHVTYTMRPRMTEIGKMHPDFVQKPRYQRSLSQSVGIGGNTSQMSSLASVATVSSIPIVTEPYISSNMDLHDEYEWEQRPVKGQALSRVEEI